MYYMEESLRRYYDTINLRFLSKKVNDNLIIKKYRSYNKYEFIFAPFAGREVYLFTLELALNPQTGANVWLFDYIEEWESEKVRKYFRELLCADGFASYLRSEGLEIKDIYVWDRELKKEVSI